VVPPTEPVDPVVPVPIDPVVPVPIEPVVPVVPVPMEPVVPVVPVPMEPVVPVPIDPVEPVVPVPEVPVVSVVDVLVPVDVVESTPVVVEPVAVLPRRPPRRDDRLWVVVLCGDAVVPDWLPMLLSLPSVPVELLPEVVLPVVEPPVLVPPVVWASAAAGIINAPAIAMEIIRIRILLKYVGASTGSVQQRSVYQPHWPRWSNA
jgi:hypothetical protein